jgi:hypothetical protein
MFGQSLLAREFTKGLCEAVGVEPEVAKNIGRIAGWTVATLTVDHHFQGAAELIDLAPDDFSDDMLSDTDSYPDGFGVQPHFGASYSQIHSQFEADAHGDLADEHKDIAEQARSHGDYQRAAEEMQKRHQEMRIQTEKERSANFLNSTDV